MLNLNKDIEKQFPVTYQVENGANIQKSFALFVDGNISLYGVDDKKERKLASYVNLMLRGNIVPSGKECEECAELIRSAAQGKELARVQLLTMAIKFAYTLGKRDAEKAAAELAANVGQK